MLKHEISYEDYNGENVTETFYFNISKSELVELDVEHNEGMYDWLLKISKTNDRKTLVAEFKRIILLAYGQKSPDGRRFIKSDLLKEEFSQTAAFNTLFMQLATEEDAAANFIKGVLPKDLASEVDKAAEVQKDGAIEVVKASELSKNSPPVPNT